MAQQVQAWHKPKGLSPIPGTHMGLRQNPDSPGVLRAPHGYQWTPTSWPKYNSFNANSSMVSVAQWFSRRGADRRHHKGAWRAIGSSVLCQHRVNWPHTCAAHDISTENVSGKLNTCVHRTPKHACARDTQAKTGVRNHSGVTGFLNYTESSWREGSVTGNTSCCRHPHGLNSSSGVSELCGGLELVVHEPMSRSHILT